VAQAGADVIELGEVQGNVLYAYGTRFPAARYVHLQIADGAADRARAVLAGWARQVTFGRRPDSLPPVPHVNLAFTFAGLAALGVDEAMLHAFPEEFRAGARVRSSLVDGDEALRDAWEPGLGRGHVLLIVHARDADACRRRVDELLAEARAAGDPLRESSAQQEAGLLDEHGGDADVSCGTRYSREHFGFADGCSQPAVEGFDDDPRGDGVHTRTHPASRPLRLAQDAGLVAERRRWRLIRPGEFLLGYPNEDGEHPDGPPPPLGPNGTFVVYRKIEQHVRVFEEHIEAEAKRLRMEPLELRARVLGRWPDGTPLDLSPGGEDPSISTNRRRANDFDYDDDRAGRRCPLGAHVRRTNPRNGFPGGAEMTLRHRIIRRGMPYTEPGGRGLVFIAYNSSIKEGFETIQRLWCLDGAALGLGSEPDYLLQQPRGGGPLSGMVVDYAPANPRRIDPPPQPFVTVRGCEYLFLPSRRACAWLTGP
jgi:Dyp-type peroxidase family